MDGKINEHQQHLEFIMAWLAVQRTCRRGDTDELKKMQEWLAGMWGYLEGLKETIGNAYKQYY